jgi:hypothetical protein
MRGCLLLLGLACAVACAQDTAGVRGIVVHAATGQPMADVHVRLWLVNRGSTDHPAYGATSDEHGRFSIAGMQAGTYFLQPMHTGFALVKGRDPGARAAPTLVLKDRQQIDDLHLALAPEVDLSGHVLDESGEPIEGVRVTAVSADGPTYLGWKDHGDAGSDDHGEYHIVVAPGRYILKAEPDTGDPDVAEEIRTDGTKEAAFRSAFYPNAPDKARATVVEADADRAGLDFRLAGGAALSISGTVAGVPQGCYVQLTLQVGYTEADVEYDQKASADAQGKFAIPHLDPGKYRLYGGCEAGGRALITQMQEVALDNSSVTVDLTLAPGYELSGSVAPAGAGRTVRLESASSDRGWGPSRTGAVAADGNFQITGIQPDRYRVLLLPPSANEYITVKLDDAPAVHSIVDLRRGGAKLKISVGRAGAIEGAVEGHPNAMVFLYPDSDYVREALHLRQTGNDGSFRFEGLAPGKYRMYGFDLVGGQKYTRFEDVAASADLVEVKAGETTKANAKILAK